MPPTTQEHQVEAVLEKHLAALYEKAGKEISQKNTEQVKGLQAALTNAGQAHTDCMKAFGKANEFHGKAAAAMTKMAAHAEVHRSFMAKAVDCVKGLSSAAGIDGDWDADFDDDGDGYGHDNETPTPTGTSSRVGQSDGPTQDAYGGSPNPGTSAGQGKKFKFEAFEDED